MPFPANPSVGDTYVENNNTYKYLGPTNGWYRTEVRPTNDTTYIGSDGAPGGVGGNTQVVFNDNGSLAGDSGLTFNKTTDALSSGAFVPTGSTAPTDGLYLSGTNTVGISTNSTGRLFVDSSGRLLVGITSTTSTARLIVQGNSSGSNQGRIHITSSTSAPADGEDLGRLIFADSLIASFAGYIAATRDGGTWTSGSSSPTRLGFWITPNGSSTPVERLRISSAGTTTLTSAASTAPFIANIGASEVARLDSSGRLLVGTTSAATAADSIAPVQIFRNNVSELLNLHLGFNGAGAGARIVLSKSRNTSHGSFTVLQNGDEIGGIAFAGDDGLDYNSVAARIFAQVDGAPGTNDMPGRIVLSTTPDNAAAPVERLRLDSSGRLLLGTTSGTSNGRLVVSGGALFNNVNTQIISTASYVNLEVMRFLVNRGTYNEDSFAGDITVHVKAQRGASINHVSCQSLKCFVTLGAFNDFNVIRMVGEVKTIDSTTLRAGTNPGSLAVALVLESSVDGGTTWSALSATTSNDTANATALIRLRADLTGTPPTSMSAITATTSVNGLVVGNISVNSTTIAAI